MKAEILKVLEESHDFVSGQQLCEQLKVSRTAVWKVMKRLKEEGYDIESVTNKGYRLVNRPDVITSEAISSRLSTKYMGRNVTYYETIGSTNLTAKELADKGCENGTLVVADSQTNGRGRRGRDWLSPKGNCIYMTEVLRPKIAPANASMVTLVAALAICHGLKELTGLDLKIKWPNDIVASKKKVCGILTEMSAEVDYIYYIVVGIGINVNNTEFSEELKDKATSLYLETGKKQDRAGIIAKVLSYFEQYYDRFLKTCDLSLLKELYVKELINYQQKVIVLSDADSYEGTALGITNQGHLLVEKEDKEVVEVYAGEVSVRGLYSYV